jgi:hypothetical protein
MLEVEVSTEELGAGAIASIPKSPSVITGIRGNELLKGLDGRSEVIAHLMRMPPGNQRQITALQTDRPVEILHLDPAVTRHDEVEGGDGLRIDPKSPVSGHL